MKEQFSKIGFILSVAGGAVGLGNAWKFPTLVGTNGGSAFVLLYALITVTIGFAIFLAEIFMGKSSKKDPVNAYKTLAAKHPNLWKYAGFSMISGILVLSFYLVILGWVIRYIFVSLGTLPTDIDAARAMFEGYVGSDFLGSLFFFFIAFPDGSKNFAAEFVILQISPQETEYFSCVLSSIAPESEAI